MNLFLSKIKLRISIALVLHQQHQLALDFGINRIHFTENARASLDLESTNSRDGQIDFNTYHS
jgi:thiamine-phosphate pyrophosphorylase